MPIQLINKYPHWQSTHTHMRRHKCMKISGLQDLWKLKILYQLTRLVNMKIHPHKHAIPMLKINVMQTLLLFHFCNFYFLAIVQFSDIIVPQRCCNSILSVRSAQLQPRVPLDEIVLFHFSQFTKWVSTSSRLHRIYDAPQRWELAELRVLPSLQLSPVGHRYSRTVARTQRRRPAEPGKKLTVGLNWLRQMSHFPTAQLVRPTFFSLFFYMNGSQNASNQQQSLTVIGTEAKEMTKLGRFFFFSCCFTSPMMIIMQ